MPPPDPVGARFTSVAASGGHYESFYLKLCHPDRPLGAWIRYTVHKPPGAAPNGSLWCTLFDADADGPRASKVTTRDLGACGWSSRAGPRTSSACASATTEWSSSPSATANPRAWRRG
jgi:hypothetical protein